MPRVELLYFVGCPNIDRARNAIRNAGISNFIEIDQGTLPEMHPYRGYSSPTIFVNGKMIAGLKNNKAACSIVNWDNVSCRITGAL